MMHPVSDSQPKGFGKGFRNHANLSLIYLEESRSTNSSVSRLM